MSGRPVSWSEAIQAICRAQIAGIRTSIPGKVLRYDDTAQRADVEILVNDFFFSEDTPGIPIYEEFPTLVNVPVRWLRAGGFVLTMPLGAGDRVWVDFAERSLSEWKARGEKVSPKDLQRHAEWATCTPGGYPETEPLASGDAAARAAGVVLGKDGAAAQIRITSTGIELGAGATDAAALASKTDAALNKLVANITAWTPVAGDGGAALKAILITALTGFAPPSTTYSTGSSLVKVKP